LRVLVAEDNDFNTLLLEQLLVRQGHRVRLAANGREALAVATEGGFDLLLLDVHMPELDGFQVVQALRELERTAGGHLPVIALTARSRKEDREHCLAAGMDDFLAKPFQAADLWAAVDRVVIERRPALLDPALVLAACGGDGALLGKLCEAFRACVPDYLATAQSALQSQNAPALREAAHKLRGVVGAFSRASGELSGALEDQALAGRLDEARLMLDQLQPMVQQLLRETAGLSLAALAAPEQAAVAPATIARDVG
jgi:CheY-like chemotaxis protein